MARALYGAPNARKRTLVSRARSARLFFAAALVPLLLGLAISLTVLVVDPLDLRPWGLTPRFFDANYPELVTPKLARAVSPQNEEVILLGGSQAMGVTPRQLRQAFHARSGFNLSYSLFEARDLDAVSRAVVGTPGLKRLIVELPFTVMEWNRPPAATGAAAIAVLNARWYALPDFGEDIALGSVERASSGVFQTSEWRREAAGFLGSTSLLENKPLLQRVDSAFGQVPVGAFAAAPPMSCSRFAGIEKTIVPLINHAAARGVELDLYFPPIPPQSYPRAALEHSTRDFDLFHEVMSFHRCVVTASAATGKANVHVLAVDLDPAIIGNLANYKDTFHLVRPDAFERLLSDVANHRFELSGRDADGYVASVRKLVLAAYRARHAA